MYFYQLAISLAVLVVYDVCTVLGEFDASTSSAEQQNAVASCEIPNETLLGVCVKVGQCTAYLRVRNMANLPAEKVNFLKKVQCVASLADTEVVEPLVCCPANGQEYLYPAIEFSKFEYRRFRDVTEGFKKKKKKLKRRIQTVESTKGFNLWNECGKQVTNRIYGGEIAELDEYPWLALLVYNSSK